VHTFPHRPQFWKSVDTSVHTLPQAVAEPGQTQAPLVHVAVDGQTCPHEPQLLWLFERSTQLPEQTASPIGQPQTPFEHGALVQMIPHAPQFFGSSCV
jgi:hypothetical protein